MNKRLIKAVFSVLVSILLAGSTVTPAVFAEENPDTETVQKTLAETVDEQNKEGKDSGPDPSADPSAEPAVNTTPEPENNKDTQGNKNTESVNNGKIETETPAEQGSNENNEPNQGEKTPEPTAPTVTLETVEYPPFEASRTVDDVIVTVTAEKDTFPEGTTLSVEKVAADKKVEEAVEAKRSEDVNVAVSYTFDIKLIDKDGNEVQPAEGKTVNVSFKLAEVADQNLNTEVYHLSEEGNEYTAESLEVSEKGTEATVETEGFSYYTVEFTYNNLQYVLNGDESIPLSTILNTVGLTGDVTTAEVSDESLFTVSDGTGEWIVTALQVFTTNELYFIYFIVKYH